MLNFISKTDNPVGGQPQQHQTHAHQAAPQPVPPNPATASGSKLSNKKVLLIAGVVALAVIAASVAAATYYANKYHTATKEVARLSDPQTVAKQEQQQLIAKIGALTPLPKGETPTVATVTDPTKLKDQAFFVNSQTGDKVLIYTQSKKAILYRPSTNKIINIAPVNLGKSNQSATTPTTKTP